MIDKWEYSNIECGIYVGDFGNLWGSVGRFMKTL